MHYWPTSLFMHSPLLTEADRQELLHIGTQGAALSEKAMYVCRNVASRNASSGASLVIVQSEGSFPRRAYLNHPADSEWTALERGGFMASENMFGFLVDALH